MEGQTKIIWDFTETAFRTGALDRILDLVQVLTGNSTQTLYDGLADLEDVFIEMADTAPMEERLGRIYETLQALTDDDILDGIGTLLSVLTPAISMLAAQADGAPMTPEKQAEIKKKAANVLKALGAIGGIGLTAYLTGPGNKPARERGQAVGKAVNTMTAIGNGLISKDPVGASEFMAGLFDTVDGQAMRQMTDTITDGFLDQRPPLLRWMASAVLNRTKKRLSIK